jgi:hypothetical protein
MPKTFITDFGQELPAMKDGEIAFMVDRYGVWVWNAAKGKHQVQTTGSDLDALQSEFWPCEVIPIGSLK